MKSLEPVWLRFYNTLGIGLDNERYQWNWSVGGFGAALQRQGLVFGVWV